MADRLSGQMLEYVCDAKWLLRLLFVLLLVFAILTVFSWFLVEEQTAEHAIVRFNLAYVSVALLITGYLIYRCREE